MFKTHSSSSACPHPTPACKSWQMQTLNNISLNNTRWHKLSEHSETILEQWSLLKRFAQILYCLILNTWIGSWLNGITLTMVVRIPPTLEHKKNKKCKRQENQNERNITRLSHYYVHAEYEHLLVWNYRCKELQWKINLNCKTSPVLNFYIRYKEISAANIHRENM